MRLLVLCPHYAPDTAPTGDVITRIAAELAGRGHEVDVVTSLPWYRHHRVEPGWGGRPVRREDTGAGRVTRVHPFPTDKRNIPARALAFAGFTGLVAAMGMRRPGDGRPDAVLAMSPPLTLGAAGWFVARRWRAPFVFNIQDVFPDVAVELGAITNPTVIRLASWLERWSYRRAEAVTVLSDDLRDNLVTKIQRSVPDPDDHVRVIPNFVDTTRIVPAPRDGTPGGGDYRREHGLADRQVVMYAGNVGFSQSLELVIGAARALADRSDVMFVINGGGSARADLEEEAAGLPNVRFVDYQPAERLPDVLAAADIHVVPLRRGLARSSVPSKLYSILAAGRPVLASVDPGTEVARVVDKAGAGVSVPPDDPTAFTAALTALLDDPARARALGAAGRSFVERWASPAAVAEGYEALFEELIRRRQPNRL
ncbi:MAG TPA: glycosyltransferase family 4 protein [Acidimicrobiales bacterium]|nr:glycosyltransferase family 4 protein [Acidimicrobiales bacterium]